MPKARRLVHGYDRVREGRAEYVRDYVRDQRVRGEREERPSIPALRRREGMSPRSEEHRREALERATKSLSRLQRKVNSRNSSGPFQEAVDELMDSLRRGEPNMRLANDLAAHVSEVRSREEFPRITTHQIEMAEEYPGQYVAHGYITTVPDAYEILDGVRHDVVFEYGGELPGNVDVLSAAPAPIREEE